MGQYADMVAKAADELVDALRLVPDVPNFDDPGADVTPPCTVLGPPLLRWTSPNPWPTEGRFLVYVVEQNAPGAVERLWELVPAVASSIDENSSAVVLEATPAVYLQGQTQLPCYELVVEVPFNG